MIISTTNVNTETDNRQEVMATKHFTYQERLDERIAANHVVEAKQRGIPLWMLRGFPALSNEPDEDDPIDFQ
jgi:hypothetical protein